MLTDAQCRNASCPPDVRRRRLTDSGGLYLEVSPAGSKRWFWKYVLGPVEKRLALGSYPTVSLANARLDRDRARQVKDGGQDPAAARKMAKLVQATARDDTFEAVVLEWYERQVPQWSPAHADRIIRRFRRDLFPHLGKLALADIKATELLAVLRKIEARGAVETADRALMDCGQVWRYGVATGRVERDICADLKGALTPYRGKHFASITEPVKFGELIRAVRGYKGTPVVRAALQLLPLVMLRPGELRHAEWVEFDLEARLWTVPSRRMKRSVAGKESGDPHVVPLSDQATKLIEGLKPLTGHGQLLFPGERSHDRPISDNTLRSALMSMGFGSDVMTSHGFRASARTMLDERLGFDPLVIEAQLAHAVRDANGRAYNRTQYLEQRRKMMQAWADYLDTLEAGGTVVPFARPA